MFPLKLRGNIRSRLSHEIDPKMYLSGGIKVRNGFTFTVNNCFQAVVDSKEV